jgi:hypothetical protein
VRIRLRVQSKERYEEDILRYCGQTEYLRRRDYHTKKNPGARIQDREDKIVQPIIVAPQDESPNKSSYQIQNP